MAASLEQETGRISVGAGTNLAGSLVARVLGLAATILLTRLLGAAGYGLWTLARSVASVGEITGCLGLGDGVARFTALAEGTDEPRRLARVLATGRRLALIGSALSAVALAVGAGFIATKLFHDPGLTTPIRILSIGIVLGGVTAVHQAASRGLQVMSHPVISRDLILPGGLVLVAAGCWLLQCDLTVVLVGQLVVSLAAMVTAVVLTSRLVRRRTGGAPPAPEVGSRALLAFSLPMMFAGLANFGSNFSDRLLVGGLLGPTATGHYVAALQWTGAGVLFVTAFVSVFAPAIARLHATHRRDELASLLKTVTVWIVAFGLPVCVLMVLLARPLMAVFGPSFEAAWVCLVILALGTLANVCTGPVGAMVVMSGHSRVELANIVVAALLTVGLIWVLVPIYGIAGAAAATTATTILVNLLRLVETRVLLGMHPYSWRALKPVGAAIPPTVLCAVVFRAPYAVATPLQAVVVLVLFCAIYTGLLLLQGLSDDDRAALAMVRKLLNTPRRTTASPEARRAGRACTAVPTPSSVVARSERLGEVSAD